VLATDLWNAYDDRDKPSVVAYTKTLPTVVISQLPNLCTAQAQGHVLIADWPLPIDVMNINEGWGEDKLIRF